jgi:c-di-GMP-related signal transduction protein
LNVAQALRRKGYRIAASDFVLQRFMKFAETVSIVKLDFKKPGPRLYASDAQQPAAAALAVSR